MRTPDRVALACYFAPRDEDGQLTLECDRGREDEDAEGPTGRPDRAGRELPQREALGIPEECFRWGVKSQAWIHMWWQVWRDRGLSAEEALARWRGTVKRGPAASAESRRQQSRRPRQSPARPRRPRREG